MASWFFIWGCYLKFDPVIHMIPTSINITDNINYWTVWFCWWLNVFQNNTPKLQALLWISGFLPLFPALIALRVGLRIRNRPLIYGGGKPTLRDYTR
jgi:hypothetical protein